MKEVSFINKYYIDEENEFVNVSFYEISPNSIPILKTDEVQLINNNVKKSLLIKISTENMRYNVNFKNLYLTLFLNGAENNLKFNFYKVESLEYPSVLPSKISTLTQSYYVDLGEKGILLNVGKYLTSLNSDYYFLIEPNVSDDITYTTYFNVLKYLNKKPLVTVSNSYDSQLPQYLKNDNNSFENCSININLYNGKFTLIRPLISYKGQRLPMNLFFNHSNNEYDSEYVNLTNKVYYNLPNNCKLNYSQVLKKHYQQDKYLYINDIGEQLHFSKVKDNYYINDNGRGLYLIKKTNSYLIEDIEGNQLEFNQDGYLVYIRDNMESIVDGYEKGIKITYEQLDNIYYLKEIKDSINRNVLITYDSSSIKLCHLDNKEIILNFTNRGVTAITNEYDESIKFIYNTSNKLIRINKDIEDLVFTPLTTGIGKLTYKKNSTVKFTKEYTYTDSYYDNITTVVSFNNQKNNNNQIIRKYCFDDYGNYKSEYEEINCVAYNVNKRKENIFEIQCEYNKKNNDASVPNYEEPITTISEVLINNWDCNLNTTEYSKTFNWTRNINKNPSFSSERLIYVISLNYNDVIVNYNIPSTVEILVKEKINNNINTIHELKFKGIKNEGFVNFVTENKLGLVGIEGSIYKYACEIPLKWYNITSENIELEFTVKIDYITKITIESACIIGDKNSLPVAYFQSSINGFLPIDDMYYYFDYLNDNNDYYDNSKLKCIHNSTMYGLTNPKRIKYYTESGNKYVNLDNLTINELNANAKNQAKGKNIFWYNNFKNIIVEDNLYYYGSPEILFDNNEYENLTFLTYTIPLFKNENEKSYIMYHSYSAYNSMNYEYAEAVLNKSFEGETHTNIIIKDIYGRVLTEEENNSIFDSDYTTKSLIKEYEYDVNNNIIKETHSLKEINDSFYTIISEDIIEYIYDNNNNVISKKVNDIETRYEYDENNNLVKIIYPLGTEKNIDYDNKNNVSNVYITNNSKEMKNILIYDDYNNISKLYYNSGKSGYKYIYNNNKELDSVYKINNTENYEILIENYQLIEDNNNDYNLNLSDNQYAIIISNRENKDAFIYDKYDKLLFIRRYENNYFKYLKKFSYKDGQTYDESKTFESLIDYTIDYEEDIKYEYIYDDENLIISINKYKINEDTQTENLISTKTYEYENGRLYKEITSDLSIDYYYGGYDLLDNYYVKYLSNYLLDISYEYFNNDLISKKEISHKNNTGKYTTEYEYEENKLIKLKTPYSNNIFTLTYDNESRITNINGAENIQYVYNGFGHLVEEINGEFSKKITYEYDQAGNLISKKIYSLNDILQDEYIYVYDEPNNDVLTKVNKNGNIYNITYNTENESNSYLQPYTINNDNLEWNNNRLSKYSKGNEEYNYYYNADGIRYKKALNKTNDEMIEYNLDGDKIISENRKVKVNEQFVDNCTLKYIYEGNNIIGFIYIKNGQETLYMYEKDPLNTIKSIFKVTNTIEKVAVYKYNAWGEHSVCNPNGTINTQNDFIGNINPFRYRGYYYDVETQLFYCNSRYYSPELCRWISPDSIEYLDPESINGLNLYCYCMNNPIMYADPSGCLPQWAMWLIGGVVIAGLAIATIATGGAAGGVAGFILAGALKGAVVGAVSGALVNGTISGISSVIDGDGFWSGFADGAAHGFMSGAVVGGITGAISSGLQVAKAASYWDKGTFSSGYKSMKYHYTQEVVNKGLTKGNSIVKYTSDAVKFANNNGMNFTLNLSRNGLQNSWSLSRYFGSGANGLYTSSGNIITFHYFYMW